jgi:hypothetical protein
VLPSESEGLSNALLEALASGVPAVATDIPANRELVGEGGALLVPPGDVAALAGALSRVLSDRELAKSLVERGLALARERELGRVVERHLELFREVAPRARPARLLVLFGLTLGALAVATSSFLRHALARLFSPSPRPSPPEGEREKGTQSFRP